jgi:hypothetical protein
MSIVLSHPTGNANVRAAANGFFEANLLAEFHTAVASFPGSMLDNLGAIGPLSEIRRRRFNPALQPLTKMFPWREIGRLTSSKVGFHNLTKHETGIFSIDAVYKSLDRQVAARLEYATRQGINAVYAYEDGAAFSFLASKRLGLQCFYDLPTGYWRTAQRHLQIERERWPEWIPTMTGFRDSDAKLSRKDDELRMADLIFVASKFTAKTLQDFPGKLAPVKIIPYGFPPVGLSREYSNLSSNRPLKLLFVGKLTQQKGIANLFAAVAAVKSHVKLTIVGHKACNDCPALNAALAKHQWIPSLHHEGVLQLMREHDVLIFPSLFDGFGLVITEAMSQGTPVIATERSAGPDLIKHDKNGWLVDAASTKALQTAIEKLLNRPELIAKAGHEAMETARNRSWEVYGRELSEAIRKHFL